MGEVGAAQAAAQAAVQAAAQAAAQAAVRALASAPAAARVGAYNALVRDLAALVADVARDPALAPQLLPVGRVVANDYNPNHVADPELDLLETSIRADGVTMPIVTVRDDARDRWVVVDGFHRRVVVAERLGRAYVPGVVLERTPAERMASTVRHNRARGKHQVELMAALVRALLGLGLDDARIAAEVGMSEEELLRLRQVAGAARCLAGEEYSRSWGLFGAAGETP